MDIKIFYDSPLFTNEGITKAARNYVKCFVPKHKVMCADTRYMSFFDKDMPKDIYNIIDFSTEPFIYIKNTRPEMWAYTPNVFLGYHVLEGKFPQKQVDGINQARGCLSLIVPSENVKNYAIESGVTKPIEIVPHIIEDKYKPNHVKKHDDVTRFMFSGAIYGISEKDRKGLDLVLKLWKDEYKDNDKVKLILKINTLYAENVHAQQGIKFDLKKYISKIIGSEFPKNIKILDGKLSDDDFIKLYNHVDCVLSPTRGEGFGLIPFEALACGTPVIVTDDTGMDQYLIDEVGGFLRIESSRTCPAEKRYPYYDEKSGLSMWVEPDFVSFKSQVDTFMSDIDKYRHEALEHSEYIHKYFSSEYILKTWEKVFEKYYKPLLKNK